MCFSPKSQETEIRQPRVNMSQRHSDVTKYLDLFCVLLSLTWFFHSIITRKLLICVCVCGQLLQSSLTLCHFMDCSPPGSSVHGILQARIPEWVAVPSSRGSFQLQDGTDICIVGRSLSIAEPPGKPLLISRYYNTQSVLSELSHLPPLGRIVLFYLIHEYCLFVHTNLFKA